jgi:hypothetical protein
MNTDTYMIGATYDKGTAGWPTKNPGGGKSGGGRDNNPPKGK